MHRKLSLCIKCPSEPRKIPKIDTTLVLFYVDTRNILKVRRGNIYRFIPQNGTYPTETIRLVVREAPVCEKLIPKPAPNGKIFLPRHVDAIPWYHMKFHEFRTSFRFTRMLEACISMLAAERQYQGVWQSFSFLACELSLQPRTNIWFCNLFLWTGACGLVLNLLKFKNQVSQCLRPSDGGRVFDIHSHFLHGT